MSYSAMHWVRNTEIGNPTLKAVLYAIANYADEEGFCWPSQSRLSKDTELGERTVRKALLELEERGVIERTPRKNDKQRYRTDVIRLVGQFADPRTIQSTKKKPAASDADGDENPAARGAEPAASDAGGPAARGAGEPAARGAGKPLYREPSESEPSEREETRDARAPSPDPSDWPRDGFDRFWKKYPQKVGKAAAETSFARVKKSRKVTFDVMMAGLDSYVAKTDDRPWCNPTTWLNQRRWEDEPVDGQPKKPEPAKRRMAI